MNAPGSLAISVVLVLTLAGCSSLPSPTPPTSNPSIQATAVAKPSATDQVANYPPAPPAEIQDWLRTMTGVGFRPLTAAELQSVVVGPDRAEARALAEPGPGYGPGHDHFVWTNIGCIYLGYYVAQRMPSYGYVPPEFPAYLVQVLAKPAKDFPGDNVEIAVIDARTGEWSVGFGYSPTPVLGTTCGRQP
jgi:hypothetical protein